MEPKRMIRLKTRRTGMTHAATLESYQMYFIDTTDYLGPVIKEPKQTSIQIYPKK